MTENEIKFASNYIKKLASLPDANEHIELYLDSLFANHQSQKGSFDMQETTTTTVSSILQFTQKELSKMDKTFKKVFNTK